MSRVERLSEDLVNKIAAGEVVERPASVVKELVENAIDAGASVVQVEIEGGGRSLIRVRDDGSGMSREDAELALERHATSKLREIGDLQAVATHGFRGEALPSIASVSDLVLRTRTSEDGAGTEVAVRQGRRLHVREAGHPRGTTVEVRDLFGAVPARRKFLRAESTEAAHVAEALTLLALARPATGFFLRSGGRGVIDAPAVESLGPRVFQLFGARFLEGLVPVDGGEEWARVSGFVSGAQGQRPPRPALRLFVNHRPVRDRALAKAVSQAYRAAGAGDRGYEAILFVDVPPSMVDVNVHPAKTEVRFADGRTAWTAVERSVRSALSLGAQTTARAATERVEVAVQRFLEGAGRPSVPTAGLIPPHGHRSCWTGRLKSTEPVEAPRPEGRAEADLRVLGQHRNTYIVATDGEELFLVDQHTAHERVRFERIERCAPGPAAGVAAAPLARGRGPAAAAAAPPRGADRGPGGPRLRRRALRGNLGPPALGACAPGGPRPRPGPGVPPPRLPRPRRW